ncbi:MAG: VWA domain-containing protein [Candidatus Hydrogenedentales bacterium]
MSLLRPFQFDILANPELLLLLFAVAALLIAELFARPHGAVSVSTGDTLGKLHGRGRRRWRWIPPVLRALGLSLLVFALARPLNGMRPRLEREDVIDILFCVDVSGSMTQLDFVVQQQRVDRLFVTKAAVFDFIENRKMRDSDRYGTDRIGLVAYAAYAWTQCPLTLDYGVFERELEQLAIDPNDEKSTRTAIGSAIGLAVSRLDKSEAESKVIILLTDGINNFGPLDPITAAQVARDYGIRVYAIGAGSTESGGIVTNTLFGAIRTGSRDPIDEESLKRIASITNAKYYRATDFDSLKEAYQEISELERTEVDIGEVYDYQDGFLPWALAGALCVGASIGTRRRWFEPIP